MHVYRIAYEIFADDPLNGEGSFLYGGRWSSPGTRMAYTSMSIPLAMLEFLAHIDLDHDVDPHHPPPLVYIAAELPNAGVATLADLEIELPDGWDAVPALTATATLGDAWIRSRRSLGLAVPSLHVPAEAGERNVLIDPSHPDFPDIGWRTAPFRYDQRILAARARVDDDS